MPSLSHTLQDANIIQPPHTANVLAEDNQCIIRPTQTQISIQMKI